MGRHLPVRYGRHEPAQLKNAAVVLACAVPPEVVEDFIQGLDEAKAERRALYGAMQ
jgi:hypothetical protein